MTSDDQILYSKLFKVLSFADARKFIEYNVGPEKAWNTQVKYDWCIDGFLTVQIVYQRYGPRVSRVYASVAADGAKVEFAQHEIQDVMTADLDEALRAYVMSLPLPKSDKDRVRAALNMYVLGNGL